MHENSAGGGAAADRAGGPLLAAPELLARLGDPRLRVIDARFELSDPAAGRAMYAAGHVPGAVYLDLDRDLADPPGERGRHPLPDPEALAERLGELGVGSEHEVVVYDQDGGRSEEHTSELQSREKLVCRLLLEKKKESATGNSA